MVFFNFSHKKKKRDFCHISFLTFSVFIPIEEMELFINNDGSKLHFFWIHTNFFFRPLCTDTQVLTGEINYCSSQIWKS